MKRAALIVAVLALFATPGAASAFTVAVQDQGADPDTVIYAAHQLGANTVRVVVTPANPQTSLVRAYRAAGLRVQAAILVKRQTTAGDVRGVMRAWHGQVHTVSIGNEPELNGVPACTYARLYRRASALIRREYPDTVIGFGEFSPNGAVEYSQRVTLCPGPRLRADFWAIHPYQPFTDPLAPGREQTGSYLRAGIPNVYWGIGRLGQIHRYLQSPATRLRLATPTGRALPIRVTEYSYLLTGPYAIPMSRAAALWPRAIRQAERWTQQLTVYGLGRVHENSTWGSASLLDRFGRGTPAMVALARALGRAWVDTVPPLAPAGDLIAPALPDGNQQRPVALPAKPLVDVAAAATGASVEDPTIVTPPTTSVGNADEPGDEPEPGTSPATDGPAATTDGPVAAEPAPPAQGATS